MLRSIRAAGWLVLLALTLSGCVTPLNSARHNFYAGELEQAEQDLADARGSSKDRVLYLMERGMIRQMRGAYPESSRDFIDAADLLEELRTYSLSKGTTSLVINDMAQDFRGAPFERTLLHAFTAKNHLAQGHWDNAAVEARRIIHSLTTEMKGDYPEDAYSRYMAGFCLEMIDDHSNASLQYRKAGELLSEGSFGKDIAIDDTTGYPALKTTNSVSTNADNIVVSVESSKPWQTELVCFVLSGKTLSGANTVDNYWPVSAPVYGEIFHRGRYLGRSYTLTDTVDIAFTTAQMEAARKAVKTISRIAIKEGIADAIEKDNEILGSLVRLVLIDLLERPDIRRWETLPRWLGVARVSCPPDLTNFDVVFKISTGAVLRTIHVEKPIRRRRNIFVSFCRESGSDLDNRQLLDSRTKR